MNRHDHPHVIPSFDPTLEFLEYKLAPVCRACSLGCEQDPPPSAMSLLTDLQFIPIHGLIKKKGSGDFGKDLSEKGYIPFWYQSGLWQPCLMRGLRGCFNAIVLIAIDRGGHNDHTDIHLWIQSALKESQSTPASVFATNSEQGRLDQMLDCALRFWIESAWIYDRAIQHDLDVNAAWPALMQSHIYLGMAWGPKFIHESGAAGRQNQYSDADAIEAILLDLLPQIPDNTFKVMSEAMDALEKMIKEKHKEFKEEDDIYKLINRLKGRKETPLAPNKIKRELERICRHTKPGRPPKQG